MSFVQRELDRIGAALEQPQCNRYAELYAAQQALMWAIEPDTYKSPFAMLVTSTPVVSEGCPEGSDHSRS